MAITIINAVRDVLESVTIEGNTVVLPEQLDRALYVAVNKVLTGIGGKWDKKRRVHIFPRDPAPYLAEALDTGQGRNLKQEFQSYYTPQTLAETLVRGHCRIQPGDSVLEPSAGHGALALAAAAYTERKHITCYDIDPEACTILHDLGFPVSQLDFLIVEAAPIYDWILMNPPFCDRQDIAHCLHAIKFLKPGAKLVAITSCMAGQRESKLDKEFSDIMYGYHAQRYSLAEDAFKESGTGVKAVVWVLLFPGAPGADAPAKATFTVRDQFGTPLKTVKVDPQAPAPEPEAEPASAPPPTATPVPCTGVGCTHVAAFQVRANYLTREWRVSEASDAPRYCRPCAEQVASTYASALRQRSYGRR